MRCSCRIASRQKMAREEPLPLPAISVGVGATSEVVWQGGEAFVLQGLVLADGRKFARLTKDKYSTLNQLLVPASLRKTIFPKTRLFEEITALRNATTKAMVEELLASSREEGIDDDDAAASGQDPTALLGFDAPERKLRAPPRSERRRKEHAARAQLPATVEVSYTPPAGGEPWVFAVVVDVGMETRKSAAVEVTASNLQRLRGFLAAEIASLAADAAPPPLGKAVKARPPTQQPVPPAKKAPRGTRGDREYFVRSKNVWVRKRLVQGGKDGVRKYRVLTRHPTEPEMPAALAVPDRMESASGTREVSDSEEDPTAALRL